VIGLRRALIGLAVGAVGLGVVDLALILGSDHTDHRGLVAAGGLLIAWSFAGTGLFAWWRRPENRFGALMTAVGFAWLGSGLGAANSPEVFVVGQLLGALVYGLLAHMVLAFPSGRLETRFERAIVAAAYVDTTVLQALPLLFTDTASSDSCKGCPSNPLLIHDSGSFGDALASAQGVIAVVLIVGLVVALFRRWRLLASSQRDALSPVLWAGGATLAFEGLFLSLDVAGAPAGAQEVAFLVTLVPFATVPFAFLVGLLRSRLSHAGALSELMAGLGAGGDRRRGLRDALADALGDPSLELAYWLPRQERYVDAAGRPVELPAGDSGRTWTQVEHEGRRVAAIVYDASLANEQDLIRAAGAAAALTLENDRLDAELRARVEELRASRARLVETADAERRRLERDLHDGAQQRLVSLALGLRLARSKLGPESDQAGALLDEAIEELSDATEELRELARGIHPAVLSDRGLDAALVALAGRARLPVELNETPGERLPPPVESAAYFVVAEALTNVARYAQASRADVRVARANGRLVVEVSDDGVGGADPGRGSGLRGLADRVSALDGQLQVDSPSGRGTVVRADIPCA
jgi:signal transduction histidine kinase